MMEDSFFAYEKIAEKLNSLDLEANELKKIYQLKWVATEKIHGANFSIGIGKEGNISYNKRKEVLNWNDDFFAFQIAVEKIGDKLQKIYRLAQKNFDFEMLIIYGELFGGEYPHPDVNPDKRVQAIQTGIYYAPSIEFCAFDLATVNQNGQKIYIDYEKAMRIFQETDFFHAIPLLAGSLNEVLNFDIKIDSTIPKRLGLPPLANKNTIEGIVVKPLNNLPSFFEHGNQRPVLKIKNQQFKESDEYTQAQKWSYIPQNFEEEISLLMPEILSFLNENRLNSTVSKIGALDKQNPERIAQISQLLLEDVLESFTENYGNLLDDISPMALVEIKKILAENIGRMIYR